MPATNTRARGRAANALSSLKFTRGINMRFFASIGVVLGCVMSFSVQAAASDEKTNITIQQGQINAGQVESFLARLQGVQQVGFGEIGMGELLSFLPLTEDERNTIIGAHPNQVPVDCSGDLCTAVSTGSEVYVNLSAMNNIPAWFGSRVELTLRWRGPTQLEICSIKNFQVKQVFWVTVDGAFVDAYGAEGSSFVDVAWGGSYPSC